MNFTVNGGDVNCGSGACKCGFSTSPSAGDLYYKETTFKQTTCTQSGGTKLVEDGSGLAVKISDTEEMPLGDFVNINSVNPTHNGMVWSSNMMLGYLVSFKFCNMSAVGVKNDRVVSVRKQSLSSSVKREGEDLVVTLDETKYRLKLNGTFFDPEDPVTAACTMIAHQIVGCVLCECENGNVDVVTTIEYSPCDQCDQCHYGECTLSNGECVYHRLDGWQPLAPEENECYELQCDSNGEWMIGEKEKVTEWKSIKNDCRENLCDNNTGIYYRYFKGKQASCGVADQPCYDYVCRNITETGECLPEGEKYEKVPGYDEVFRQSNKCFEVTCIDDKWSLKQMDNVTEWKKGSDGCVNRVCDNETGLQLDNRCWKTVSVPRYCQNHQCYMTKRIPTYPSLDIIFDSLDLMTFKMSHFDDMIQQRFGRGANYTVAWETEFNGQIHMIIGFDENDLELALMITDLINNCV